MKILLANPNTTPGVTARMAGVARAANEAPESYARRAALALPGMAAEIERIGDLYVRLRYAGDQAALGELKRNIRALSQR